MMALDASTSVAVSVAAVTLSVGIEFTDVVKAMEDAAGRAAAAGAAEPDPLALQPASAAANMNNAKYLANDIFNKRFRT